jgi:hypothetical protein
VGLDNADVGVVEGNIRLVVVDNSELVAADDSELEVLNNNSSLGVVDNNARGGVYDVPCRDDHDLSNHDHGQRKIWMSTELQPQLFGLKKVTFS